MVKSSNNYSRALQSWKGTIIRISEEYFHAELEDLTNPGTLENAEIEIEAVSPSDRELIEIGSVFYWNIGYVTRTGQVRKESIIRFQRIVSWDEDEFNNAADSASELFEQLVFD